MKLGLKNKRERIFFLKKEDNKKMTNFLVCLMWGSKACVLLTRIIENNNKIKQKEE